MGDDFFKIFFIAIFVLLFLVGAVMFLQMEQKTADERAERAYMESRGKTPLPPGWRDQVGSGI